MRHPVGPGPWDKRECKWVSIQPSRGDPNSLALCWPLGTRGSITSSPCSPKLTDQHRLSAQVLDPGSLYQVAALSKGMKSFGQPRPGPYRPLAYDHIYSLGNTSPLVISFNSHSRSPQCLSNFSLIYRGGNGGQERLPKAHLWKVEEGLDPELGVPASHAPHHLHYPQCISPKPCEVHDSGCPSRQL